jgi:hypothetical protein
VAAATRTASPVATPSGGLAITRSLRSMPEAISSTLPRSRPTVIGFSTTRSSLPSVATCVPALLKISALGGMLRALLASGASKRIEA